VWLPVHRRRRLNGKAPEVSTQFTGSLREYEYRFQPREKIWLQKVPPSSTLWVCSGDRGRNQVIN